MVSVDDNLWPVDQLQLDAVTPLTLVKTQAAQLGKMTGGVLIAEVVTSETEEGKTEHAIDVVAPSLDYRYRILAVWHDKDVFYPVTVWDVYGEGTLVPSQSGVIAIMQRALASDRVVAVLNSLIARINEAASKSSDS